jgi:glycosyltransferase involved in cell wall biosynthesis
VNDLIQSNFDPLMIPRQSIVMFAQVPPPEHGQSRMVLLALEALREQPEVFEVHHVNARFSNTLEDIGESSVGKVLLTAKYLIQAIRVRLQVSRPVLYYVPGPVKWSSVVRDWVVLSVLRLIYRRVVFHWHAIGHGEWAHGSQRLGLAGPQVLDRVARKISARVLNKPFASIAVSENSGNDAVAVASHRKLVVCNGLEDPCPRFGADLAPLRDARRQELAAAGEPCFHVLFLSHGTYEKGLLDAVACMNEAVANCDPGWRFRITFAGGVSETVRVRFAEAVRDLVGRWPGRVEVKEQGYLTGDDKHRCFVEHDIFLAPSRWESFGLTVVEAMAYGLPVVAAASDGVEGVLPAGYPYLAPVGKPGQLAGQLIQCCAGLKSGQGRVTGAMLREYFLSRYQVGHFAKGLTTAMAGFADRDPLAVRQAAEPGRVAVAASGGLDGRSSTPGELAAEGPVAGAGTPLPVGGRVAGTRKISLSAYLADQNPGHDRSFGISRMSLIVLEALEETGEVSIEAITSRTSQRAPECVDSVRVLPWGTRRKFVRLLTDHFHPLFRGGNRSPDLHYFPKGYLPLLSFWCRPSVVTIHDTIIQYDNDHYPKWRSRWEYGYWAMMLKHTLRQADRILTVSEFSKGQIEKFMRRHRITPKEITVTYEPCLYERIAQPVEPAKGDYVIHLASAEPHKRTAHLIRWWHEAESVRPELPALHLIGTVPREVAPLLASSRKIVKRPFLEDSALQAAYLGARALVLPSEIEGFGLPAVEAYYLGTPVCYVNGTSVEEVLAVVTRKGGFSLEHAGSLFTALDEVLAMTPAEVRECGLKLRETYSSSKVVARMLNVFETVKAQAGKPERE